MALLVELAEALQSADVERAIAYGLEARKVMGVRPDPDLVRRSWRATGNAHLAAGRQDSTLAHAERLKRWAEVNEDARGLADAALLSGFAYRNQRAFEEARAALREAERRYSALGVERHAAEALYDIGRTYANGGDYEAALTAYDQATERWRAIDNKFGVASGYTSIGIVHAMQGNLDAAASAFALALEVREEIGDEAMISNALTNLGALHSDRGDFKTALEYQERALAIRERLGSKGQVALTLHNVGIARVELGDHASALRAFTRSADLFEEVGDEVNLATTLSIIGNTHADRGDFAEALAFHRRALALHEASEHNTGVAQALHGIGEAHRGLGDYAEALGALERSLVLHEEIGNTMYTANVLASLGGIRSDQGDFAGALAALERAQRMEEEMEDRQGQAKTLLQIGEVFIRQGDLDRALANTDDALAQAEALGILVLVRNAHRQRVEILERQERFAEALAAHRAYKAAHDSIFTSESESVAAELREEYRTREQRQQIELLEREREVQRQRLVGLAVGLALLALLAGLALYGFRLKQRANRSLTEARDDLEAAQQRLRALDAAKSRFFANVSHEFRTPLTLTLGPLDDLRGGAYGALPGAADEQLGLIQSNARRLLRLVNQLLDVARLEAGETRLHLEPGNLAPYVQTIAEPFAAAAERRGVAFTASVPSTPVPVRFDPAHLDKAVANVLSNAFKFTPEGGTVTLAVETDGGEAVVAVADTGRGIAPEAMDHLFERFYQGEKSEMQPGTGIGLSLAKELVELHDGRIEVESTLGEGSTFTIRLPLVSATDWGGDGGVADTGGDARTVLKTEGRPESDAALRDASAGDGLPEDVEDRTTVLVVDDNAEVRAYVRHHLEGLVAGDGAPATRYRVVEAEDGEAALDAVRARLPDAVVSDVMMPRRDGFSLLEALRSDPETDFLPVVLLTARAEAEDRLAGLGLGADDYLTKPFDARELVARVDNLIAQRRRLRERFRHDGPPPSGDGASVRLHPAPVEVDAADAVFLETVRAVVEDHLGDEDFGVEVLAEAVGQSRTNLYRRLTALVDETPAALVRRMRLERAADLLRQRAGTVSEVAYAVGFKSVAHFSTSFRRQFDATPTVYVRKHAEPKQHGENPA